MPRLNPNGDEDKNDPTPYELKKQRRDRARAFKLKKWIMSIENQPTNPYK